MGGRARALFLTSQANPAALVRGLLAFGLTSC
jgi:hypothetical protein